MSEVVVLNACAYERHDVVSFKKAMQMLVRGVAEVFEGDYDRPVGQWPRPLVLRLVRYVVSEFRYRERRATFAMHLVLVRDRFKCAYCLRAAGTVDHIRPRAQDGESVWLNTVAACRSCNHTKGNRTPEQADMPLRFDPFIPTTRQLGKEGRKKK